MNRFDRIAEGLAREAAGRRHVRVTVQPGPGKTSVHVIFVAAKFAYSGLGYTVALKRIKGNGDAIEKSASKLARSLIALDLDYTSEAQVHADKNFISVNKSMHFWGNPDLDPDDVVSWVERSIGSEWKVKTGV
jgi:hypothetical protein